MKKIILITAALGILLSNAIADLYISEAFARADANGDVFARVECVDDAGELDYTIEAVTFTLYPGENFECDYDSDIFSIQINCTEGAESYFHTVSEGTDTYCAVFETTEDAHLRFFIVPREINVQSISDSRPLTALFSALTALGIAVALKKKK